MQSHQACRDVTAYLGEQKTLNLIRLNAPICFFINIIRQVASLITEHRVTRKFALVYRCSHAISHHVLNTVAGETPTF
ncbi:MAG: hypothetical protein DID92_2727744011 [Candidatus Nitrotoga sp. SPKER]|nr:MAG: hypothetical protein DID92_2727744011 [Candidatus Nitrotoga sp. SPKER]